jgi:hypothetical protein
MPALILAIILEVLARLYTRGFSRRLKLASFSCFSVIKANLHYNIGRIGAIRST